MEAGERTPMSEHPRLSTASAAPDVLEAAARYEWHENPNTKGDCLDHAIPKVDDLLPWLPECPVDVLDEALSRAVRLFTCFSASIPEAARLDWRHESHRPTSRWLAFSQCLSSFSVLALESKGADAVFIRAILPAGKGLLEADEVEALHHAWRAVREPHDAALLDGWFDVDAAAARRHAAMMAERYGGTGEVGDIATTADFIARFPASVEKVGAVLHPLTPLVRAWQGRARNPADREIVTVEVPGRAGAMPLRLVRSPAALDLSINAPIEVVELEALEVDGEPFAGRWPEVRTYYRRRVPAHVDRDRGQLALPGMPGPRTLKGEQVNDAILSTLSERPLTGDERSPLRGDVVQVARFGFAVTGNVRVTDAQGAAWLGGRDTPANRARWNDATETAKALTWTVNPKTRTWIDLANITRIDPDTISIGAPGWWRGRGHKWRLTAGLWRPAILGAVPARGTGADTTTALSRTLDGIEAALSWGGRTRGAGGRIAPALRPVRKGGAGEPLRMPWRDVLTYSGEHVPDGADPMGTEGRRYRRRIKALKAAGYFCGAGGQAAPAGDSVEIVEAVQGTRSREPELVVRASARLCEAVAKSQRRGGWSHYPASRLFRGTG